jgi:choline transport protein
MDDKVLGSVGDLELADQARGATPNSDVGGNMTRDEGEMAFYGKKSQLKVRVLHGPAPENLETDEE